MADPVSAVDPAWDFAQKLATGGASAVILVLIVVLYFVNKERVAANRQLLDHLVAGDRANNRVAAALEGVVRKMDFGQKSIVAAVKELQASIRDFKRRRGGR